MITKEEIIPVGKFQKTHALKGELNMIIEIDPEYFLQGNPLIIEIDGIRVPYYVESLRPKGNTSFLVKLEGIDSEKSASQFVNKELNILKKDAEEWLETDYEDPEYWEGFEILDYSTGEKIGVVEGVDDSTPNVLFIIKNDEGEEVYLPANDDFVAEIDEDNHIIKMIIPEGLLDLNKKGK